MEVPNFLKMTFACSAGSLFIILELKILFVIVSVKYNISLQELCNSESVLVSR
jgi:hypothetical protein